MEKKMETSVMPRMSAPVERRLHTAAPARNVPAAGVEASRTSDAGYHCAYVCGEEVSRTGNPMVSLPCMRGCLAAHVYGLPPGWG